MTVGISSVALLGYMQHNDVFDFYSVELSDTMEASRNLRTSSTAESPDFLYSREWFWRRLDHEDDTVTLEASGVHDSREKCTNKNYYFNDEDKQKDGICYGIGAEACKKIHGKDAWWHVVLILLGLLYLFIGIAIVCDELFVPALEIIAEEFEMSNDVAGATLMAAGGSAPELATSFVGTFKRTDVGFGTIVGSAVFNVLFVIAMCVIFTPEKYAPLQLTWFPLFRDCSYYVLTLTTLAIFMMDETIELWEAIFQFCMYIGYVVMMSYSSKIEEWANAKFAGSSQKISPTGDGEQNVLDQSIELEKKLPANDEEDKSNLSQKGNSTSFLKPSTFRVGILQLMKSKIPLAEAAGVAFISKIKGDVDETFRKIDTNQNGEIDANELKQCLLDLGTPAEELTEDAVAEIMKEIDKNGNGHASKADFTTWYTGSEERLRNKTRESFEKYATGENSDGNKNTISKEQIYQFMADLGHDDTEAIRAAIQETIDEIETPTMTYTQFTAWYENSLFWQVEKANAEEAVAAQESMFMSIVNGFYEFSSLELNAKFGFISTLPLCLLFCLIPDCRPPGREKYAFGTLIASVLMIACLAIVMVEFAEIVGKTIGIPDVVMGITILAAGTSVPDLLSSVIVAKQGEGDMAVSSSIGSNIFDVGFGLPLPWIVYNLVIIGLDCPCWVEVSGSVSSLLLALLTLLGMVIAVIIIIHFSNWKMTHSLGYSMLGLYGVYLFIALFWADWEDSKCKENKFSLGM